MPFDAPFPYGTAGGFDDLLEPQVPEKIRRAVNPTIVVFLHVNGILTEKDRQNVEDVIRVLDLTGVSLVAILIRDDGIIIDNAVTDVDFLDSLQVSNPAPGVVIITIPDAGIPTAKLADAIITAIKLADNAVTTAKILDGNVTLAKLAADSVDTSKIVAGAVGSAEIATDAVDASKILALAVGTAELAAGAVTTAKLATDAVTANEIAANAVGASEIAAGAVGSSEIASGAITFAGAFKYVLKEADLVAGNEFYFSAANFGGTITGWRILGNTDLSNGSIVVDVWRDTYAAYAAGTLTDADRIAGTEKITLSAASEAEDLTLSTWTTAFTAMHVFALEIESVSSLTHCEITIFFTRTIP